MSSAVSGKVNSSVIRRGFDLCSADGSSAELCGITFPECENTLQGTSVRNFYKNMFFNVFVKTVCHDRIKHKNGAHAFSHYYNVI